MLIVYWYQKGRNNCLAKKMKVINNMNFDLLLFKHTSRHLINFDQRIACLDWQRGCKSEIWQPTAIWKGTYKDVGARQYNREKKKKKDLCLKTVQTVQWKKCWENDAAWEQVSRVCCGITIPEGFEDSGKVTATLILCWLLSCFEQEAGLHNHF